MPRYIDADILKDLYQPIGGKDYNVNMAIIRASIDDIPTADVQEVKHGKWLFENGYITCSNCKCQPYKQSKTIDYYNLHNYCPNCGAKMDGE